MRSEYSLQYYFLERYFSILSGSESGGCLTSVVVVVAVVVVVVEEAVEIDSTLVAVGRGGDYLDTSGGSSSRDCFFGRSPTRSLSCGQLTVL
jgi:hypothetical protein